MKHRVHLYVTTRVVFDGIEAETHEQAIVLAEKEFLRQPDHHIARGAFADEITAAMVDEEGDDEFARTTTHTF